MDVGGYSLETTSYEVPTPCRHSRGAHEQASRWAVHSFRAVLAQDFPLQLFSRPSNMRLIQQKSKIQADGW